MRFIPSIALVISAASIAVAETDNRPAPVVAPPAPVFICGCGGTPARTVLLCDVSTAAASEWAAARAAVEKSIDAHRPNGRLNVLIARAGGAESLASEPQLAGPDFKAIARQFLADRVPTERADPVAGVRAALANQPHYLYWITDGNWADGEAVRAEIRRLNVGGRVRINVIDIAARSGANADILKRIADENGGLSRVLDERRVR